MLQLDLGTDYADYTDFFYDPILYRTQLFIRVIRVIRA